MKRIGYFLICFIFLLICGCNSNVNDDTNLIFIEDIKNNFSNLYIYNDLKSPIIINFDASKKCGENFSYRRGGGGIVRFEESYSEKNGQKIVYSGDSSFVGLPVIIESFSTFYPKKVESETINKKLKDITYYNPVTHEKILKLNGVLLDCVYGSLDGNEFFTRVVDYSNSKRMIVTIGLPFSIVPSREHMKMEGLIQSSIFEKEKKENSSVENNKKHEEAPIQQAPISNTISPVFNNNITIHK